MEFDLNKNKEVIALLGAGSMGTAIVKRIGSGKTDIFRRHKRRESRIKS